MPNIQVSEKRFFQHSNAESKYFNAFVK